MELINPHLIQINATFENKHAIFESVCNLLEAEGRLSNRQQFLQDLHQREESAPTALGHLFAIPHAKSKGVKQASLVFIKLKDEMEWTETEKAQYIFAIAVPEKDAGDKHLEILAMLARKMMDEDFRQSLTSAKTKEEYFQLFTNFEASDG